MTETLKKRRGDHRDSEARAMRHNQPTFPKFSLEFLSGMASIFSLLGTFEPRHYEEDPWELDFEALQGDWNMVGQDMQTAMDTFEDEHSEEIYQQKRLFDPNSYVQRSLFDDE